MQSSKPSKQKKSQQSRRSPSTHSSPSQHPLTTQSANNSARAGRFGGNDFNYRPDTERGTPKQRKGPGKLKLALNPRFQDATVRIDFDEMIKHVKVFSTTDHVDRSVFKNELLHSRPRTFLRTVPPKSPSDDNGETSAQRTAKAISPTLFKKKPFIRHRITSSNQSSPSPNSSPSNSTSQSNTITLPRHSQKKCSTPSQQASMIPTQPRRRPLFIRPSDIPLDTSVHVHIVEPITLMHLSPQRTPLLTLRPPQKSSKLTIHDLRAASNAASAAHGIAKRMKQNHWSTAINAVYHVRKHKGVNCLNAPYIKSTTWDAIPTPTFKLDVKTKGEDKNSETVSSIVVSPYDLDQHDLDSKLHILPPTPLPFAKERAMPKTASGQFKQSLQDEIDRFNLIRQGLKNSYHNFKVLLPYYDPRVKANRERIKRDFTLWRKMNLRMRDKNYPDMGGISWWWVTFSVIVSLLVLLHRFHYYHHITGLEIDDFWRKKLVEREIVFPTAVKGSKTHLTRMAEDEMFNATQEELKPKSNAPKDLQQFDQIMKSIKLTDNSVIATPPQPKQTQIDIKKHLQTLELPVLPAISAIQAPAMEAIPIISSDPTGKTPMTLLPTKIRQDEIDAIVKAQLSGKPFVKPSDTETMGENPHNQLLEDALSRHATQKNMLKTMTGDIAGNGSTKIDKVKVLPVNTEIDKDNIHQTTKIINSNTNTVDDEAELEKLLLEQELKMSQFKQTQQPYNRHSAFSNTQTPGVSSSLRQRGFIGGGTPGISSTNPLSPTQLNSMPISTEVPASVLDRVLDNHNRLDPTTLHHTTTTPKTISTNSQTGLNDDEYEYIDELGNVLSSPNDIHSQSHQIHPLDGSSLTEGKQSQESSYLMKAGDLLFTTAATTGGAIAAGTALTLVAPFSLPIQLGLIGSGVGSLKLLQYGYDWLSGSGAVEATASTDIPNSNGITSHQPTSTTPHQQTPSTTLQSTSKSTPLPQISTSQITPPSQFTQQISHPPQPSPHQLPTQSPTSQVYPPSTPTPQQSISAPRSFNPKHTQYHPIPTSQSNLPTIEDADPLLEFRQLVNTRRVQEAQQSTQAQNLYRSASNHNSLGYVPHHSINQQSVDTLMQNYQVPESFDETRQKHAQTAHSIKTTLQNLPRDDEFEKKLAAMNLEGRSPLFSNSDYHSEAQTQRTVMRIDELRKVDQQKNELMMRQHLLNDLHEIDRQLEDPAIRDMFDEVDDDDQKQ